MSGVRCYYCPLRCRIPPGERGRCGLSLNKEGRLVRLSTKDVGILEYYYDPLPTNCVASCVCEECARGYGYNLAVFMIGCNLGCKFCQNWIWRSMVLEFEKYRVSVDELVEAAKKKDVRCVCFFGGDPAVQMPFVLNASEKIYAETGARICFETNGVMLEKFARKAAEICIDSRGYFKVDIKAWSWKTYRYLTGVSSIYVKKTLLTLSEYLPDLQLVVSLLLVPKYVNRYEIEKVCEFISKIDKNIPIVFLAFHPDFLMRDLPCTSRKHAEAAVEIARKYGLKNVFVENVWLLSDVDYEI